MKTLTAREYDLLDCILRTGDLPDLEESTWDLFEPLEDRGLVDWFYGPITREIHEAMDPDDPDYDDVMGEELDPFVTTQGRLAMTCYRIACAA